VRYAAPVPTSTYALRVVFDDPPIVCIDGVEDLRADQQTICNVEPAHCNERIVRLGESTSFQQNLGLLEK
jgi:hypothetical protein